MDAPQITAGALWGSAAPVQPMAVSPYGLGLAMPGYAPVAVARPAAAPGSFSPFEGVAIGRDFWSSASFGLILLVLLVAYFDIRLVNR